MSFLQDKISLDMEIFTIYLKSVIIDLSRRLFPLYHRNIYVISKMHRNFYGISEMHYNSLIVMTEYVSDIGNLLIEIEIYIIDLIMDVSNYIFTLH